VSESERVQERFERDRVRRKLGAQGLQRRRVARQREHAARHQRHRGCLPLRRDAAQSVSGGESDARRRGDRAGARQ
jgi:hypothetical protein